jgi:CRP-like cAMP-binding protein
LFTPAWRAREIVHPMDPDRLARLPLFAELSADELAEVAAAARAVSVAAGTTVADQGDNAYEFFVIESGTAEVRRDGELLAALTAGDVVGEIGLLVTGTRTAAIVATSPLTLVALFAREFRAIERRVPAIATSLRATIRDRVARSSM